MSSEARAGYAPSAKTFAVTSSAFLVAIAMGSASLGMVFYARELYGVSAGTVGILAASNSLTYVAGCLLLRPVFRRVRSRDCLLIAASGSAVVLLGVLLIRNIAATFVLYSLFGFLMAFFWPPLAGWLSSGLEARSLGRATARFNLSWSVGNIVSSYVAGALSELDSGSPLVLSVSLYVATALMLIALAIFSPSMRADEHRESEPARGLDAGSGTRLRFPAWVGLFGAWTAVGVLVSVFPLHARETLGIAKSGIGTLLFLRSLCTTIAFLLLGRLQFWHYRVSVMAIGLTVFAALLALFSLSSSPVAIGLLMCGIGPCGALAYSSSLFHGLAGSGERARRMGIHEAVLSSGMVAGSVAGGYVYQEASMALALAGCAVVLLLAAAAELALAAALKRSGAASP